MKITVSIVIVNYNTKDLLVSCIDSIYEKTEGLSFEVLVVDNDSHDGSEVLIRNKFPEINFIQSGANIGFGRANNLGIQKAKGDYIFLLNSDTILLNNAIAILSDYLDKNSSVAVCGANLYDANQQPTDSFCQLMPGIYTDADVLFGGVFSKLRFGKNSIFNHSDQNLILNGYVTGADMMIRKKVLDEVGLFDPDFFMYFEETELTSRIKKRGYAIASVPEAKIIHLEGASETIKENTMRRMIKSKYIYFEKTNKKEWISVSYLLFLLTAWTRIVLFKIKGNHERDAYWASCLKLNQYEYQLYRESKK
ncbi:GT2 family glycosyltransferase [Flavobacterium sp. CG_23.5]|uniref:glycosyltransferase family 2 protein n=1 Tax=Flavobacterium sp. CG_23.5 TaxID=2760708 RepID=UPI001AE8DAFB|nr:glycosyltransferase family 2 protein [Flavobacterium sp. CG_23.5]MBP2283102.1 GT2 family glycosyltransferase [Flavobacterium sp. CG_23.5]